MDPKPVFLGLTQKHTLACMFLCVCVPKAVCMCATLLGTSILFSFPQVSLLKILQ